MTAVTGGMRTSPASSAPALDAPPKTLAYSSGDESMLWVGGVGMAEWVSSVGRGAPGGMRTGRAALPVCLSLTLLRNRWLISLIDRGFWGWSLMCFPTPWLSVATGRAP